MTLAAAWRTETGTGAEGKLNCDAAVQVGGHGASDPARSRAPGVVAFWLYFEGRADGICSWIGCGLWKRSQGQAEDCWQVNGKHAVSICDMGKTVDRAGLAGRGGLVLDMLSSRY